MPLQCTEDGNDLLLRMVSRLIRVISAELKMPRTFKDWNLATTSLTICWPSPGSRVGGELIYLWLGPKTAWILLCHIWNISWHFPTQMGSPFNKATSTSVPAPGQQGFFLLTKMQWGAPGQQGDKQKLFPLSILTLSGWMKIVVNWRKPVGHSVRRVSFTQLLVSSHERSKSLQNVLIWCPSLLSLPSSTSTSSSWSGPTLCPRDLWGHEGIQVGVKRANLKSNFVWSPKNQDLVNEDQERVLDKETF